MTAVEARIAADHDADLVVVRRSAASAHRPVRGRVREDAARRSTSGRRRSASSAASPPGSARRCSSSAAAPPRFSWYVRLPGPRSHPLVGHRALRAGRGRHRRGRGVRADSCHAALPRFASEPHKDARAPQNLYPIAGLGARSAPSPRRPAAAAARPQRWLRALRSVVRARVSSGGRPIARGPPLLMRKAITISPMPRIIAPKPTHRIKQPGLGQDVLLRRPEPEHQHQDAGDQTEPPHRVPVLRGDRLDDGSVPLSTNSSPSTEASAHAASFGLAKPQIAPPANSTPRMMCSHFHPGAAHAVKNSLIAPTANTTPMRMPIVVSDGC